MLGMDLRRRYENSPGNTERRNGTRRPDVIIEKDLNVVDVTAYVVSRDSDHWDRDNVGDVAAAGEGLQANDAEPMQQLQNLGDNCDEQQTEHPYFRPRLGTEQPAGPGTERAADRQEHRDSPIHLSIYGEHDQ